MRGTSHQLASAALGMYAAYRFHPSLEVGAAFTGGMVAAAKGPDQLEFRQTLNGLRALLRPFKPRPVRNHPGEFTKASMARRGWDRFYVLPHGPSELFVERLFIRHRGPTHWLVPTALIVAGLAWLLAAMVVQTRPVAGFVAVGVLAGYVLHPLLDAFNLAWVEFAPGVRVWAPRWLRVRSGGFADSVFAAGCLFVVVYCAVKLAPADWQDRAREAAR